ncbi:hypothetical protein OAF54_00030 [bacterium]|nr:hypothetical protein [bacterium]
MSASNIRGGIQQSEASIVVKKGAATQLTITHQATNTAARVMTLPANDADFLVIPNIHGGDVTKAVDFNASGATTAKKLTISSSHTDNRTLTMPDATDTLMGKATTDTMTNKTFDVDGTGNTLSNIANANIKAAAAIALNKLAAITASVVPVADASGFLVASAVTATELGYVSGLSSAVQTQLDAKLDDVATANDNEIPRFNTNGQALQNSGVTIDDSDNVAGVASLTVTAGGSVDVSGAGTLTIAASAGANNVTIGGATSTVVIAGNLQVDGTTTTVNSTTMDVTDANITINNGGNQAAADGTAGLTVEMSDATDTKIVYDSTLTSRFKVGDSGSESEIVTAAGAQTITAVKTFSANPVISQITNTGTLTLPTSSDTLVGRATTDTLTNKTIDDATTISVGASVDASSIFDTASTTKGTRPAPSMTQAQRDAIGTPATGLLVYNTDVNQYQAYNGTSWSDLGGGGAGEINYIDNHDAEDTSTTGWATYDDGASATPVDGTGGTSSNLTLTNQDTTVLRGSYSFKLAKGAADAQGEGASYDFSIDKADVNKLLKIQFDYNTGGTYAADDLAVYIIGDTGGTPFLITPSATGIAGWDKDNDGSAQMLVSFSSTDATDYRLIFHVTSTSASAYDFYFDNVIVGPGSIVTGAAIGPWTEETTVSVSALNPADEKIYWRRSGEDMEIYVVVDSGTPTAATDISLTVPNGKTINTALLGVGSGIKYLDGVAYGRDTNNATNSEIGVPYAVDSTTIKVITRGNYKSWKTSATGYPYNWEADDRFFMSAKIPIAEWAGSGTQYQLNDNMVQANYRAGVGETAGGDNLTNGTYNLIKFDTSTFGDSTAYDSSTGVWTAPFTGEVTVSGTIAGNATSTYMWPILKLNDAAESFNANVYRVGGKEDGREYADFNWTVPVSEGDTLSIHCYWSGTSSTVQGGVARTFASFVRVADYTAGQAVGLGLADADNAGLVTAYDEGTWTPAEGSKGNVGGTGVYGSAYYTRIGRQVTAILSNITSYTVTTAATTSNTYILISTTGLPDWDTSTMASGSVSVTMYSSPYEVQPAAVSWYSTSQLLLRINFGGTGANNGDQFVVDDLMVTYMIGV